MVEIIPLYDSFQDNEVEIAEDIKNSNEQAALQVINQAKSMVSNVHSAEELKNIALIITGIQKAFFDNKPAIQINNQQNISNTQLNMFSSLLKADI